MIETFVVLTIIVVGVALLHISQMPTRDILRKSCGFCIGYSAIELVMMGLHLLPFELPAILLSDKSMPTLLSAICCLSTILVSAAFLLAEKRRWVGKNVTMLIVAIAMFVLNTVNIFTSTRSTSSLMLIPTAALIVGTISRLREEAISDAKQN